jgi:exodeoxyribonuclease V alpha subunit
MSLINHIGALEAYLLDTRQIPALALRQARVLSRGLADENRREELRIVLLLCLAALHKGAPRADVAFLLKPLEAASIDQHARAFQTRPEWVARIAEPAVIGEIATILEALIDKPELFAPLSGPVPLPEADTTPLLIASRRSGQLGFSRYWRAVEKLENKLCSLLRQEREEQPAEDTVQRAHGILKRIFGAESILPFGRRFHFRQAAAAALALRTRFLIVSGGPGTGKTSVVIQILRALLRFYDPTIMPDRIALCAPTGRAKARMGESVDAGIKIVENRCVESGSRDRALDLGLKNLDRTTLHGLLGVRADGGLKYNAANPLPHQVIVVDEASMVDLYLFAALMEAAGPGCRIILLGDMHQLPSVEAGAVLGDLTARFLAFQGFPSLTSDTAAWVQQALADVDLDSGAATANPPLVLPSTEAVGSAGPLADHAVILTQSYRSAEGHGIQQLCDYVNRGKSGEALRLITRGAYSTSILMAASERKARIRQWLDAHYLGEKLKPLEALNGLNPEAADDPGHPDHAAARSRLDAAFAILGGSRILVLGHVGGTGRAAINRQAEALLRPALSKNGKGSFFHGQQVILERNHHDLDLYNGDLGIVVQSKDQGLKVVFRRKNGYSLHAVERLTGLESAYAMTVHKSQGSEFGEIMLVLPEHESPLLSRQIIYTGITRARDRVFILGSPAQLEKAIEIQEARPGGVYLEWSVPAG